MRRWDRLAPESRFPDEGIETRARHHRQDRQSYELRRADSPTRGLRPKTMPFGLGRPNGLRRADSPTRGLRRDDLHVTAQDFDAAPESRFPDEGIETWRGRS